MMDEVDQTVREAVRSLREAQGLSQGGLADRLREAGWTSARQTTVSRIEKGEQTVKAGELVVLARVLNTDVEALVLGAADRRAASAAWAELADAARAERAATWRVSAALDKLRAASTPAVLDGMDDQGRERVQAVLDLGVPEVDTVRDRARLIEGEG